MLFDYANVAIFLLFAVGFVLVSLTLSFLLAPRAPSAAKKTPYECGELPQGSPWIRFNARYYLFALVFLIFDVEVAFMFPCAAIFRQWVADGKGLIAFAEISSFALFLIVGLAYVWRRGDLEWIRTIGGKA